MHASAAQSSIHAALLLSVDLQALRSDRPAQANRILNEVPDTRQIDRCKERDWIEKNSLADTSMETVS